MFEEKDRADKSSVEEKKKETSGEYLFRVLKPAGCIAVLILFIIYLIFCFTYKSNPADVPQPTSEATEVLAETD